MEPNLITPLRSHRSAFNGICRCVKFFLKDKCIFGKFVKDIMEICVHGCIYKVIFNMYLDKLTTYIFTYACLPT